MTLPGPASAGVFMLKSLFLLKNIFRLPDAIKHEVFYVKFLSLKCRLFYYINQHMWKHINSDDDGTSPFQHRRISCLLCW